LSQETLAGVRACVFDAYGTLFDYASAAAGCRDQVGDKLNALTALWREKQLQYTWLRSLEGRHADFWQATGDVLDFALDTLGLAADGLHARLMNLYLTLDCFPDVPEMLQRVRRAGLKTAILSNGSSTMLAAASAFPVRPTTRSRRWRHCLRSSARSLRPGGRRFRARGRVVRKLRLESWIDLAREEADAADGVGMIEEARLA